MFFNFVFWEKTFRILGHNFPIGLSKLHSTSPQETSEEISLPEEDSSKFNQFNNLAKSWSCFWKYKFRNSSKICISRVHRNILRMNWKKLFMSPSDVWVNGLQKFVGKFPAVLSTPPSPCPWVGTSKRASFFCEKVFFFVFELWTPSATTFVSLMKSF